MSRKIFPIWGFTLCFDVGAAGPGCRGTENMSSDRGLIALALGWPSGWAPWEPAGAIPHRPRPGAPRKAGIAGSGPDILLLPETLVIFAWSWPSC
jgi:hypothetical protein